MMDTAIYIVRRLKAETIINFHLLFLLLTSSQTPPVSILSPRQQLQPSLPSIFLSDTTNPSRELPQQLSLSSTGLSQGSTMATGFGNNRPSRGGEKTTGMYSSISTPGNLAFLKCFFNDSRPLKKKTAFYYFNIVKPKIQEDLS